MKKDQHQLNWLMVSLIAFKMVWGLGNVVNNYSQQGISVVVSWVLILALYFIPYSLIVGQLGSTFKESGSGVSDWVEKTSTKRLAYFAAWTYWVVHIPYLAQKPQGILIPLGWALQGNGQFLKQIDFHWIVILSLLIFGLFLYLSTKGLATLKVIGSLAGSAMLIMSLFFVLLAVGLPFIKPDIQFATPHMDQLSTYIPNFDFSYFTTISLLVFAVGGCEKISPYVNQTRNPAKEFPKGMIVMAIMVGLSAILGSVAMGMLFDGNNIPEDLMRNGAYQAFQMLAPLQILLNNADENYIPSWLRKRTEKGVLINGYLLTGVLVSLIIILPIFGIQEIDGLVKWMTNLNSIVMPMRYLWVFLAYMMLNRAWKTYKNAEYKFVKNPKLGFIIGTWCFLFTAFACILGMVPKINYAENPTAWQFSLLTNILTPIILIGLGVILPVLAKKEQKKQSK